ncbi:MAG TPA: LPXTG cell wall anchor domain-containing protein [Acidimicrobiia bacterium]|nr:LPXTG cell wall anchor domain-containing protein [Acidimicrobiia bacterium]
MTIWRGRRCRAALASALRGAGVGLLAAVVLAVPATAGTDQGGADDPRDVGTRLDLKTLTHGQEGSSIVYTAETYTPFSDQLATLKWGIDRDQDEAFDLIVFTEWQGGKLSGGVKDPAGRQVAPAAVSRPGPNRITVSFPAEVLGDAPVYRYAVDAEAAPGERDLVPNSGLVQHRLGAGAPEVRTASSAPATPQASPPTPEPVPAAPQAAAPAATTNLPRTGPGDRTVLPWSGVALMAGGALVALGARRRVRREVTGGIR